MESTDKIAQLAGDDANGEKSRTFVFQDEGHTLGNVLKCIISRYPDVDFVGYTVPHPAENKMHFRIQAREGRAVDILTRGFQDLVKVCDHVTDSFTDAVELFRTTV